MEISNGPFGAALRIDQLDVGVIEEMYADKCGAVLDLRDRGITKLDLFECTSTGLRFWRPETAAGDEAFYRQLSARWPNYYRDWRWEYGPALSLIRPDDRVLEVGCGRGYFLALAEGRSASAEGLEFNSEAIANKITRCDVHSMTVEELARQQPAAFDVVCSFQVLEHVVDPAAFIAACLECLRPGGLLIYSTPNPEYEAFKKRLDAFDLPPHHMNHFSDDSYRNIAKQFSLEVVRLLHSPCHGEFDRPGTGKPLFLSRNKMRKALRNACDRLHGVTGATTLVALRK